MSEERYSYSDDIESIVDMKDSTDGLGIELTTSDVVLRLNQLEAEKEALRDGIQDVRNISGTEWGRCEKDSPWGKAFFWIMQKCEALLTKQG